MSHAEERPAHLKHRHDIGAVDHGPEMTVRTTHGIQIVLSLCIAATAALLVYALAAGITGAG